MIAKVVIKNYQLHLQIILIYIDLQRHQSLFTLCRGKHFETITGLTMLKFENFYSKIRARPTKLSLFMEIFSRIL